MTNALLTGLSRSGTTLICHLLNKLPDVVALDEPMDIGVFKGADKEGIIRILEEFFKSQRERIASTGTARSKSFGGKVPTNQLADTLKDGRRERMTDGMQIVVDNVKSPIFELYIKHPSFFAAVLPSIERHFPCYACIRNPLSILLSWRTSNFHHTHGRATAAEMMDAGLSRRLDAGRDVLDRQLILMDFFFSRFAESTNTRIIRYEDIIETQGRALSVVNPRADSLSENLTSRNDRQIGKDEEVERIADRLLESDIACWRFYDKEDVTRLLPKL